MTDAKTTGQHVTETSFGSAASANRRDTFTEEPDGGNLLVRIWRGPRGRKPPGLLYKGRIGVAEKYFSWGLGSASEGNTSARTIASLDLKGGPDR
jgi:hypothetical protein